MKTLLLCVLQITIPMDTLIQIGQILFILSVLVILHEFGHFIPAKLFKVRVEKFYLFMDAGFSLIKKKIKDTEWGIGWLPIGGYVKLAGMVDESLDTEQLKQEPQPWEFRSKPAWQRLIIMLGGITVNILLAWLIYTVTYSTIGKKTVDTLKVQEKGLSFGEVGLHAGFRNGDKIVAVDGEKPNANFNWMVIDILLGDNVTVDRNGKEVSFALTDEHKKEILGKEGRDFIKPRDLAALFNVDSTFTKNTGLAVDDKIIGVNGQKVVYFDQLSDSLRAHKNQKINLLVERNKQEVTVPFAVTEQFAHGIDSVARFNYMEKIASLPIKEVESKDNEKVLQAGDKIVSVNGKTYLYEFYDVLKDNTKKKIAAVIDRNGKTQAVELAVNEDGKLGIRFDLRKKMAEYMTVTEMSLGQAVGVAVKDSYSQFVYNIKQFKLILKPKTGAYKQIKSPIGITRKLPTSWDWEYVWSFMAMFSIGLAFMNLLPIPGLDGGHALFTIVEMITGKTLSEKAMGYVQTAGMIFLLSLMALTFGKDIYDIIIDNFFKKV